VSTPQYNGKRQSLLTRFRSWEINYDPISSQAWMKQNNWIPCVAVGLYIVGCIGGRAYFAKRDPWNMRTALALWNLFLSTFSFIGVARTLPYVIHNFSNFSWRENFCVDPERHIGSGATGLWCQLFALSKMP